MDRFREHRIEMHNEFYTNVIEENLIECELEEQDIIQSRNRQVQQRQKEECFDRIFETL